jgi:hypothetical protein
MRFVSNGPSIPADLIEQRNLGNVIFFCGAGISQQAGLPDFGGLTARLISRLGAEKARRAFDDNESFDRVFNALISEFGASEIDRQIYLSLKTPRHPQLDHHRTIFDLSRSATGNPQIVTTNFDLLFECVDRRVACYIPPALPGLALGQPIDGVVYLHGRLTKPDTRARAGYVISSADFGRAYLAEGWAARFVKELRERFTIVLLGYSANDPPMRYLLEGLHTRERAPYNSPIYAFASGNAGEIEEEWQDRGVTPIAYDPVDVDHSGLWDTLSAWASAAVEPGAWGAHVVRLAQQPPSVLQSFERGQVATLVTSKAGAKLFADAKPSPPAEWLCVFDPITRYAKPKGNILEGSENVVDPLDLYGLDDDPPRPDPKPNDQTPVPGLDLLSWTFGDSSFPERVRLAGWNPVWSNQLPERLHHLAWWIGKVMGEPAAIWWAAGWASLHPSLLRFVKDRLDRGDDLPAPARRFWQLYLEAQADRPDDQNDYRWSEFEEIIKREGWSPFAVRQFRKATRPYLDFTRYPYGEPRPPASVWDDLDLRRVVEMNVRVMNRHGSTSAIPADKLATVVSIIRQSLEVAAQLLGEIGTLWWRTPTLHPTGERGETFHGRKELYFLWFRGLFLQLVSADPGAARREVQQWDADDPFFFGKLAIFAQMHPAIATAREVARTLTNLSEVVLWDPHCQREFLFTLRARWSEFSERERRRIEKRIINGPSNWNEEKPSEYRRRKAAYAASRLRWLELNDCRLTSSTAKLLPKLTKADPRWNDDWARAADDSLGPRGGAIERVRELRGLDALPINQIVEEAEKKTEDRFGELKDYRPFEGFVAAYPFRALSALRLASKTESYPIRFWMNLLSEWPDDTPERLRWLMADTLVRLPVETALELRHYFPGWIKGHLTALEQLDRPRALEIFDAVIAPYRAADPAVTRSGVGATTVGGVVQERSEVSFDKAVNSPCGKLTECLLSFQQKASKSRAIPEHIRDRLRTMFELPGDGGGHSVCIVTQRMGWFDFYYRAWTTENLIPMFVLSDPRSEAAWHGLAHDRNGLSTDTLKALNPAFLEMLSGKATWRLNESEQRRHIQRLVSLCSEKRKASRIVSFHEARTVLMKLDDGGRADAVLTLSRMVSKTPNWRSFVKPFIENAWPRQTRYRSEQVSRAFVALLDDVGDDFPDAVKTVLPFLRPVPHLNMITYRLTKEGVGGNDLVRRFPTATLSLLNVLVADDRTTMPYGLTKVLELLAETVPSLRRSIAWRRLNDLAG